MHKNVIYALFIQCFPKYVLSPFHSTHLSDILSTENEAITILDECCRNQRERQREGEKERETWRETEGEKEREKGIERDIEREREIQTDREG